MGIDVNPQSVEGYDPTKVADAGMAKRWRELFAAHREAFVADTNSIGLAHRAVRLRRLEKHHAKAEKQGNTALAVDIVVEAEKICGELYTNKRVLTGANGKPLIPAPKITPTMTAQEAADAYARTREELDM